MKRTITSIFCFLIALAFVPALCSAQVLADKLPGKAIVYIGWRGTDDLGPGYADSHLKHVLDHCGIQELIEKSLPKFIDKVSEKDQKTGQQLQIAATLLEAMVKHPSALEFSVANPGQQPEPLLVLACKAGDDTDALEKQVKDLAANADTPAPIAVFRSGDLLIVSMGYDEQSFKDAVTAGTLADAATFKEMLTHLHADPTAVMYVDLAEGFSEMDAVMAKTGHSDLRDWNHFKDASGIGSLKQMIVGAGFDGADWGVQEYINAPAPWQGLLGALRQQPLTDDFLKSIPQHANMVVAASFDLGKLYAGLHDMVNAMDPESGREFDRNVGKLNDQLGIDVEHDLLDSLGSQWAVYIDPAVNGQGVLGATLVNKPTDPAKLEATLLKVQGFIAGQLKENIHDNDVRVDFGQTTVNDLTIHYFDVPFASPAWAIHGGNMYAGLFVQTVQSAAQSAAAAQGSILDNHDFTSLRDRLTGPGAKPTLIEYVDLPATVPQEYATWLIVSRVPAFADLFGIDTPPILLPTLPELKPELGPAGAVGWFDDQGWHVNGVEPFPCAALLGTSPLIFAGDVIPLGMMREQHEREERMRREFPETFPSLPPPATQP